MTQECTLKEAFIASKLDELQPDWRDGEDVRSTTKQAIQQHVQEKYKELLDIFDDPRCITIRAIECTTTRVREKFGISSARTGRPVGEDLRVRVSGAMESKNGGIDNFAPDEIVHEPQLKENVGDGDVCVYEPIPIKSLVKMCPCGCGYGYFEDKEKWYSPKQMENKYV